LELRSLKHKAGGITTHKYLIFCRNNELETTEEDVIVVCYQVIPRNSPGRTEAVPFTGNHTWHLTNTVSSVNAELACSIYSLL
jgi:hypothetical protein